MKGTNLMRNVIFAILVAGAAFGADPKRGMIGPDDTVTIVALNVEEISKPWRVGASGELNLPMVGRVAAAGKSVDQLETEIAGKLKTYVKNPQVTIFVSELKSSPVTVTGAVEKPGTLQLERPMPLFAVLAQAGGIKDPGPTITISRAIENGDIPSKNARRSQDGKSSMVELPVQDVLRGHGDSANIEVRPFDSITVSTEKKPKLVYLAGEFNKPGAIELATQDTVSLTKALAMAGGLTHTASAKHTVIRHFNDKGQETAFAYVDLRKVLNGQAKDLTLTEGDVVLVGNSSLSTYLQTMSSTAISSSVYILGRL
jgi:polysaccharide biosynthesis/export protein